MQNTAAKYSSEKYLSCFENKFDYERDEGIAGEMLDSLRRQTGFMRTKTYKAGRVLEAEIFPFWNARRCVSRAKRHNPTKAAQEQINRVNTQKKISRYINANFTENDYWATFTYDEENNPGNIKRAVKDVTDYIKKLRYHYEKRGLELKYVYVTEYSENERKKVRAHHHIVLTGGIDRDLIEQLWTKGGRRQTRRLQPDKMGITGLAHYFAKGKKGEMKWNHSHGLKLPEPTIADNKFSKNSIEKIVRDEESARELFEKTYPGYELYTISVKYSEFVSGVYVYATMAKTLCADCANRERRKCIKAGITAALKRYSCAFYRGKE